MERLKRGRPGRTAPPTPRCKVHCRAPLENRCSLPKFPGVRGPPLADHGFLLSAWIHVSCILPRSFLGVCGFCFLHFRFSTPVVIHSFFFSSSCLVVERAFSLGFLIPNLFCRVDSHEQLLALCHPFIPLRVTVPGHAGHFNRWTTSGFTGFFSLIRHCHLLWSSTSRSPIFAS